MQLKRGAWPSMVVAWLGATVLLIGCAASDEPGAAPAAGETSTGAGTSAATTAGGAAPARPGGIPVGGVRTDFTLGACEATVSGGVTASIKSGGDAGAANSEYWFSEAELLQAARQAGAPEATVRAKLAAQEFAFYPLILNCGDSRTGIVFQPVATTHEQFPFRPGTYRVSPGATKAPDGEVNAAVSLNGSSYLVTSGSFEVTQFDRAAIAGTFQLQVEEQRATTRKSASVTGRFQMKCSGAEPTREGCAR